MRLYYHQTDGGAEYLCTRPVADTDEGDMHYAAVRLDGNPCLFTDGPDVSSAVLDGLAASIRSADEATA